MQAAYDSIYFDLKGSILDGTYGYRCLLPSESSLVERYGCAHNTVRKALAILASEGFVQPIHGKGVRVLYQPRPPLDQHTVLYTSSCIKPLGFVNTDDEANVTAKTLSIEPIEVDDALAACSGYGAGEHIVHISLVQLCDNDPLTLDSVYLREDLVECMVPQDSAKSVLTYLRKFDNEPAVTCQRLVSMETASDEDCAHLGIEPKQTIPVVRTKLFDKKGLLCAYVERHHRPEVFMLEQTAIYTRVSTELR